MTDPIPTAALNIRAMPRAIRDRITSGAGARNMTLAQYLAALVELHDLARARIADGDVVTIDDLEGLGLQTVTA